MTDNSQLYPGFTDHNVGSHRKTERKGNRSGLGGMLSPGLWGQRDPQAGPCLKAWRRNAYSTAAEHNTLWSAERLTGGLALKMTVMDKNLVLHSSQSPKFWAQHPSLKSHCNSKLASAKALLPGDAQAWDAGSPSHNTAINWPIHNLFYMCFYRPLNHKGYTWRL